jgi:peroxiredoxin
MPEVGETAPGVSLTTTVGLITLPARGLGKIILAFYVEDGTPG